MVVVFAHNPSDAIVVKVKCVPNAAAEIGFGVHEGGVRGELL